MITPQGQLRARNVVVATGPYQRGRVPPLQRGLAPEVLQIHAGDYRNPHPLAEGAVLVVGSGASGCQIADELIEAGRHTYLSVGRHLRAPRRYRGRDAFWWRRELGLLDQTAAEVPPEHRLPPRTQLDTRADRIGCVIWATGYNFDFGWIELPEVFDADGRPIHRRGVTETAGLYFLGLPWLHKRKSTFLAGAVDDAAHIAAVIGDETR
jgi:pyridine nucleotide-disulfide oxidoreductase